MSIKRIAAKTLQWIVALGVFYLIWQLIVVPSTSRAVIATPASVWTTLGQWVRDGTLWSITGHTLGEALLAFAIAGAVGILLALAVTLLPAMVGEVIEPAVTALYAAPKFVLVPLLVLWLHQGFVPVVVLVVISLFPQIFLYTVTGVRTVDPDRVQMMRLAGASGWQIAFKLLLPHALGYIATGLTLSAPHAVTISIGAEILLSADAVGIGGTLSNASQLFQSSTVMAALVVGTILCLAFITLSRKIGEILPGVPTNGEQAGLV
jgi:NitT/TauT family transport system permease protein